jgi:thiazole synthase
VEEAAASGLLRSARNDVLPVEDMSVTPSPDLSFYGVTVASRLLLGTSQYPSPAILAEAARASGAEVVTVSLRRESARLREGQDFWRLIRDIGARVLPNTAGCYSVKEAVTTAQMAREVFGTPWIKLEVIGEADTLQPDVFGLVEAARILASEGFEVFPYTTEDLVVAERLLEAGCKVLMPWGAPIGSGKGLNNVFGLRALRAHFPDVPLIVDAGVGLPSHAAAAMELGYDGVLLNTAVAKAGDSVAMARAFAQAIEAGRAAFLAGPMQPRDMAAPSTPVVGRAVLT